MENLKQYANKTKLSRAISMSKVEEETRTPHEIYIALGGLVLEDIPKPARERKAPAKKVIKKATKK